jgi:hypothetical protein
LLTNPTGIVSGSSPVLQGLEASFRQDLNGDGMIGPSTMNLMVQNMATVGASGGAEVATGVISVLLIDQDVLAHPNA